MKLAKNLQNNNPLSREKKPFNPFLGTFAGWFRSFSSLFYVAQWVGRSNLTLLVENGPVFRLARRTLGISF
jgi:hypothetical protein